MDPDRTRPDSRTAGAHGTLLPPPESPSSARTIMFQGALLAGRYCLLKKLGEGGMGRVWLATHIGLGRLTAIKVLHHERHVCANTRERFRREALAGGALHHRNIVPHLDFGTLDDGREYLATEYVDGRTLADELHGGPLPWKRAVEIGRDVASALACAHHASIIHRDVKPSNILLEHGTNAVRVLDFGVAHVASIPGERLTMAGSMLGTPSYCAPEQRDGLEVDGRADLYSLGLVLFEMITGRKPHTSEPMEPALADAPRALKKLITALCDPRVDERPGTAREVERRLERIRTGPIRRAIWIAATLTLTAGSIAALTAAL